MMPRQPSQLRVCFSCEPDAHLYRPSRFRIPFQRRHLALLCLVKKMPRDVALMLWSRGTFAISGASGYPNHCEVFHAFAFWVAELALLQSALPPSSPLALLKDTTPQSRMQENSLP